MNLSQPGQWFSARVEDGIPRPSWWYSVPPEPFSAMMETWGQNGGLGEIPGLYSVVPEDLWCLKSNPKLAMCQTCDVTIILSYGPLHYLTKALS